MKLNTQVEINKRNEEEIIRLRRSGGTAKESNTYTSSSDDVSMLKNEIKEKMKIVREYEIVLDNEIKLRKELEKQLMQYKSNNRIDYYDNNDIELSLIKKENENLKFEISKRDDENRNKTRELEDKISLTKKQNDYQQVQLESTNELKIQLQKQIDELKGINLNLELENKSFITKLSAMEEKIKRN